MPILAFLAGNWKLVLLGLLVAAIGVQTFRLNLCHEGRAEDRVNAEAERVRITALLQAQEQAVAQLVKESRDKKAQGEKALKEARESTRRYATEAERLRGLAKAGNAPTASCPAGDAVSEIRRGLR